MKRILWITIAIAALNYYSEVSGVGPMAAYAQEKPKKQIIERWECFDKSKYQQWELSQTLSTLRIEKGPVLAKLKRIRFGNSERNFEFGEIDVSGSKKATMFTIQGINRRWDFGKSNEYAVIILPNRSAAYYDFRGSEGKKLSPNQRFICEQR